MSTECLDEMKCSPREQVVRKVQSLISQRRLLPEAEVPAENLLADRLGVARGTVRSGLAELTDRGVLVKRGRRLYVAPSPGGGLSLMNQTVILLGSKGQDEAIRVRNSGFLDAVQVGALEETTIRNMHSMWLNIYRLSERELEELSMAMPGGVLLFTPAKPNPTFDSLTRRLAKTDIPIVSFARSTLLEKMDYVLPDHAQGARRLTKCLLDRGRRRIVCYLPAGRPEYWVAARYQGYCAALREAGLTPAPLPESAYWGGDYDDDDAWEAQRFHREVRTAAGYLIDYFASKDSVPDALLAQTDWDVPILAAALRLLGYEPGKDVVIAGYDNKVALNGWAELEKYTPPLTIDRRNDQVGRRMVARLSEHIEAPETWEPKTILIEPELVCLDTGK